MKRPNENVNPRTLQQTIAGDPRARARLFAFLNRMGLHHSGEVSGGTLALACGVNPRTWRKWVSRPEMMPLAATRLLLLICWPLPRLPSFRKIGSSDPAPRSRGAPRVRDKAPGSPAQQGGSEGTRLSDELTPLGEGEGGWRDSAPENDFRERFPRTCY
jgi:hypothetical protein